MLLAALAVAALSIMWLARSTPPAFPFGDVAVIEIATGAALRQRSHSDRIPSSGGIIRGR